MVISLVVLLLLAAFIIALLAGMNKVQLWPAVLLLALAGLLQSSSPYLK